MPHPNPDDADLVNWIRLAQTEGQEAAQARERILEELESTIRPEVDRLSAGKFDLSEQVLNEVRARLLKVLGNWNSAFGTVRAYAVGVARMVWREQRRTEMRTHRKRASEVADGDERSEGGLLDMVRSLGLSPSRSAAQMETVARLRAAIPCTTPEVRELLELLLTESITQAEAARRLDRQPYEVARLLKRAEGELRTLMGGPSRNVIPGWSSRPDDRTGLDPRRSP